MRILLSIFLIPFLAAAGHDLWINFIADEKKLRALKNLRPDFDGFLVSDLGWIWEEYAADSLEIFRDSFSVTTWDNIISPILQMSSMLVAIIPFAILAVIALIIKLCTDGTSFKLMRGKPKASDQTVYKHAKSNAMKFKKK